MILALDLGTRMGWALGSPDGAQLFTGWEDLKQDRYAGGGMRYLKFKHWLDNLTEKPDAVWYEEVRRHAGTSAAHVYGGFQATLTAWCEHNNVPYASVPVGTIKKHATGKGNASKSEMLTAALRAGRDITDDNEADAFWLLRYVLDTHQ